MDIMCTKIHKILNVRNKIRVLNYLIWGRWGEAMIVLQNCSRFLSDKTKYFQTNMVGYVAFCAKIMYLCLVDKCQRLGICNQVHIHRHTTLRLL